MTGLFKGLNYPHVIPSDTNQPLNEHSCLSLCLCCSQVCWAPQFVLNGLAQTPVIPYVPSLLPASGLK